MAKPSGTPCSMYSTTSRIMLPRSCRAPLCRSAVFSLDGDVGWVVPVISLRRGRRFISSSARTVMLEAALAADDREDWREWCFVEAAADMTAVAARGLRWRAPRLSAVVGTSRAWPRVRGAMEEMARKKDVEPFQGRSNDLLHDHDCRLCTFATPRAPRCSALPGTCRLLASYKPHSLSHDAAPASRRGIRGRRYHGRTKKLGLFCSVGRIANLAVDKFESARAMEDR